jgi:predicted DCC family thiol-disulfide oxidoreductase YuxK
MAEPYSYRRDPAIPPFPDDRPLFVFDGVCVLCSTGVRWLMRHDPDGRVRFATAQSPIGSAIYRHYGRDIDGSYMLLDEGRLYEKSDGYLHLCKVLGGWWQLYRIAAIVPRPLRDFVYDIVARNRYGWFGKTGYCELIPPELKARLL